MMKADIPNKQQSHVPTDPSLTLVPQDSQGLSSVPSSADPTPRLAFLIFSYRYEHLSRVETFCISSGAQKLLCIVKYFFLLIFQSHNVGTFGSTGFPSWTAGWKVFSRDDQRCGRLSSWGSKKFVEQEDSLQDVDWFSAKMVMNTISVRFVAGIDGWTPMMLDPEMLITFMMIPNPYSYVVKHQVRHHGHHPASMDGAAGGVFEQCCGKCLPQWVLLLSLNAKYHLCQCTMNLFRVKES